MSDASDTTGAVADEGSTSSEADRILSRGGVGMARREPASSAPGAPPEGPDIETRLLEATLAAYDAGGDANVRVSEVARQAGVTTGAIYSHFQSREHLIAEALLSRIETAVLQPDEATRTADAAFAQDPANPGAGESYWRELADPNFRKRRLVLVEALVEERLDPLLATHVESWRKAQLLILSEAAMRAQAAGWIRSDFDAWALAELWAAVGLGLSLCLEALDHDPALVEEILWAWTIGRDEFAVHPSARFHARERLKRVAPTALEPHTSDSRSEWAGDRDAIIAAVLETVRERGGHAVRVAHVARQAGVPTSLIYRHFIDRDHLLAVAYAEQMRSTIASIVELSTAADQHLGYQQPRSAYVETLRDQLLTSEGVNAQLRWAEVAIAATRDERMDSLTRPISRSIINALVANIEIAQQSGLVRQDVDPQALAMLRFSIGVGLALVDVDPTEESKRALMEVWTAVASAFRVKS